MSQKPFKCAVGWQRPMSHKLQVSQPAKSRSHRTLLLISAWRRLGWASLLLALVWLLYVWAR